MNEVVNDDNTAATNEDAFLVLLDQDISAHPERLQPIENIQPISARIPSL